MRNTYLTTIIKVCNAPMPPPQKRVEYNLDKMIVDRDCYCKNVLRGALFHPLRDAPKETYHVIQQLQNFKM